MWCMVSQAGEYLDRPVGEMECLCLQARSLQWGENTQVVAVYEALRIKILKEMAFQHLSCSSLSLKSGNKRDEKGNVEENTLMMRMTIMSEEEDNQED